MPNFTRYFLNGFLILCFSMLYNNINGQSSIDTFDIATYARPDLERRTFSLTPSFRSDQSYEKVNDEVEEDFFSLGSIDFFSTTFINSERYQITKAVFGQFDFLYDKHRQFTPQENRLFLQNRLNYAYSKKHFKEQDEFDYPDDPKKFFELNLTFDGRNSYEKYIDSNDEKIKTHHQSVNLSLPFYWGHGRIEFINDAWQATQILEFLDKQFLIKNAVSKKDVYDFATKISEIKNLRNTDNRLQLIEQYEMLCKYLIDSDLVYSEDFRFFPHLLDAWRFESFTNRRSGTEFKYGFSPTVSYSNFYSKVHEENSFVGGSVFDFQLIKNKYIPKGMKWQFNQSHSFEIGIATQKLELSFVTNQSERFLLATDNFFKTVWSSMWEVQFLPSQRINYTLSAHLGYRFLQDIEKEPVWEDKSFGFADAGFSFSFQYYISPQFRWNSMLTSQLNANHFNNKRFTHRNSISFSVDYLFY